MRDRNRSRCYPANPDVIAVTATDEHYHMFDMANRGRYIAVAAPGVDILALAPGGAYQVTTGTSIAAAHVSGIAALLLERKPSLTPSDIRSVLVATAKQIGPPVPGFRFWRRSGERLSRRDMARPQAGRIQRRRHASQAIKAA